MNTTDFYNILGVKRDATDIEIKNHFIAIMDTYDKKFCKMDNSKMKKLRENDETYKNILIAYEFLSDPKTRHSYDENLKIWDNFKNYDQLKGEIDVTMDKTTYDKNKFMEDFENSYKNNSIGLWSYNVANINADNFGDAVDAINPIPNNYDISVKSPVAIGDNECCNNFYNNMELIANKI